MVNHGVSRGCRTCKKRRKKCDETRPVCKACVRTGRQCLGYESDSGLVFRHYHTDAPRDAGAPRAFRRPKPGILLADTEAADRDAVELFIRDYCIVPGNPALSRGYLHGAAQMLRKAGHGSALASVARVLTLGGLGRRWNSATLRKKAQWLYQAEIRSFQERMVDKSLAFSEESLTMVILFGLYEIISSPFPSESDHGIHALGITAIRRTPNSPFELLKDAPEGSAWDWRQSRIFSAPNPKVPPSPPSLDALGVRFAEFSTRSQHAFGKDGNPVVELSELCQIGREAEQLFDKFQEWPTKKHPYWASRCVGHTSGTKLTAGIHGSIFWPGQIHVYADRWVATLWIIYCKGCIMLADIATRCAVHLPADDPLVSIASRLRRDARPLLEKLLASIPYFLLDGLESAFDSATTACVEPAPPAGGILLMHPLYMVTLQSEVISGEVAGYMRGCLRWIDRWQGVAQASVLADSPDRSPREDIIDAHTVVWAGVAG